jgi:hypothetical protein
MAEFANEATWDRIARVVVGAVLVLLGFAVVQGGFGIFLGIVGLVLVVTGLVGWCPLYAIFKFRTNHQA